MSVLTVIFYVVLIVIALLLIGLILIQPSKSGGMGAAFGGIGESVFGGKAGSHLTKTTVVMTAIFFVVALGLAALIGHGLNRDASLTDAAKASEKKNAVAAAKAEKPVAKAEKPAAKAEKPAAKAKKPVAKAEKPVAKAKK